MTPSLLLPRCNGESVEIPGNVKLPLAAGSLPEHADKEVILGVRPEHFETARKDSATLHLTVDNVELLGADTLVYGRFAEDKTLSTLRLSDVQHLDINTKLPLTVPPQ